MQQKYSKYIQKYQMGIQGLLALLKPITIKQHISSFKNKTVGVDIMPWLYKGCYSHVMEMSDAEIKQSATYTCSNYLLQMLAILEQYNIVIIAVYDGRSLPMKGQTISKRSSIREQNSKKSKQMLQTNDKKSARKYLSRGVRIDEAIILESMRILSTKNIKFMVSPYESDCQLAKLHRLGMVDLVITEDSDLLVYGCDVVFKLDEEGICDYVQFSAKSAWNTAGNQYIKMWSEFDEETRIGACVLAGCDYVGSVRGVGLKKAIKMIKSEPHISHLLAKLRNDKTFGERVPPHYQDNVIKAFVIFQHALVYNPITHQLEPLSPISSDGIEPEFYEIIGHPYNQYFSCNIYRGQSNPRTLQPRTITPITLPEVKQIEHTNLTNLKNKTNIRMDEQEESSNSQFEMNMFQVYKNAETSMEATLWGFQQNFVNICVQYFVI